MTKEDGGGSFRARRIPSRWWRIPSRWRNRSRLWPTRRTRAIAEPCSPTYYFEIEASETADDFFTETQGLYAIRGFDSGAYMQLEDTSEAAILSPPYICEVFDQLLEVGGTENFISFRDIDPDGSDSTNVVSVSITPEPTNFYINQSDNFLSISPTTEEEGQTFDIELIAEDTDGLTSNATFSATVNGTITPTLRPHHSQPLEARLPTQKTALRLQSIAQYSS